MRQQEKMVAVHLEVATARAKGKATSNEHGGGTGGGTGETGDKGPHEGLLPMGFAPNVVQ